MKTLYLIISLFLRDPVIPYPDGAGIASEMDKSAMRYHGIQVSIEENGKKYFIRNGQYCTLINQKFLKVWNRKEGGWNR